MANPGNYWIYPSDGDWIGIYPEGGQPGPLPVLRQYLQGEVPTDRAEIDFWDSDVAWVLSDGPQVAAPIPEDNFAVNSAQAGEAPCLHPGRFVLIPAVPELSDHSHCGTPSRRVLLAKQIDDGNAANSQELDSIPYILDLRPVQLPLYQAWAPEGVVNVSDVCQRLLPRCLRGFHIRLYGGAFEDDMGNHFRRVRTGEIISAEFHPDYVREAVSQLEPGTYSSGTSLSDSHRSAQDLPSGSASSAHSASADAGTGGSMTHPSGAARHRGALMTQGRFPALAHAGSNGLTDKWFSTFSSVHAIPHGKVGPTPVCEVLYICRCPWACLRRLRCKPSTLHDVVPSLPISQPCTLVAPPTPHRLASAALSAMLLALWWGILVVTLCLPAAAEGILLSLLVFAIAKRRGVGFLGSILALLVLGPRHGVLGVQLQGRDALGKAAVPMYGDSCPDRIPDRAVVASVHPCLRDARPLPTPCRAGRATSSLLHASRNAGMDEPPTEVLRTLLEESCSDQAGYPYYLAATLLDVLYTHFAPHAEPRPVLSLQVLVPPPAYAGASTDVMDCQLSGGIPVTPSV